MQRCCAWGPRLARPSSTPCGSRGACLRVARRASGSRRSRSSSDRHAPVSPRAARCEATAEILLRLIGLAQERGARTVGDLVELSAPRRRRVYGKRSLAFGAPTLPGVYLFRDAHGQVLYVGRARDLRARLRSYFRSERQRPAVEAALSAVESIEWRVLGSELEAALEELRLLRELRPPANARSTPAGSLCLSRRTRRSRRRHALADAAGPAKSRRRAELAARALEVGELERPRVGAAPAAAQARDARRRTALRGRGAPARPLAAVEASRRSSNGSAGCARASSACWLPAAEPGFRRAFFIASGRVAAVRTILPREGSSSRLGWRRRVVPSLRSRPRTPTNCSSSPSSCAGRRPSCAS